MKTIISFCLLMMAISFTAVNAQPNFDPKEMAQRETEWMKKDLSLTAAQVPAVDSVNVATANKRVKAFESANGDFEGIRAAMEKINTEQQAAFKAILSKEQYDLYIKKSAERRPRPGGPQN